MYNKLDIIGENTKSEIARSLIKNLPLRVIHQDLSKRFIRVIHQEL